MNKTRTLFLSGIALMCLNAHAGVMRVIDRTYPTVAEDFNYMWNPDASEAKTALPPGWRVDRNLNAPRTVGKWAAASTEVMYTGGVSLASNAKNGTWNFGDSADPSDRAVGGLTTTVSNGTRCLSLMTALNNGSDLPVDRLTISYDIEKYRKGANAAGFAVQLYYSGDGENWTSAGEGFHTLFPADSETAGAATVPISSASVTDRTLLVNVAPDETIYLAWNISVASGSTPDKAQGLAIDNVVVTASFADTETHYLMIENALRARSLSVYSPDNDTFGPAPGVAPSLVKTLNGVSYDVWEMAAQGAFDITAVADGISYGPVTLLAEGDSYFCLSPEGLAPIANPEVYTGWVDPNRAPFVPSGIYLRGEVNSWGADSEWEFSKEEEGTYVLYDKELRGQFKVADASWSASCNYGSNGSNILPDTPYTLTAGTDANISCGSYVFKCRRIVLSISTGTATLLIELDDDDRDLTSVYIYGDFNDWNYMSTDGELRLDTADNLFKGLVSMKAGADGLSRWMIYQRPGMGGAWGLEADAASPSTEGVLSKGMKGKAAALPGTYNISFSLADGSYTLTPVESRPAKFVVSPQYTILTPENPEKIKVLSLNNSLIHYNDQDFVFNDIASAMGTDAAWTKHTNLGKPLSYHWNEGDGLAEDGTPGAKMMIRSDAWSHIILQEQSSLPRTNPETFRNSVAQWMEYIRQYCPNPNATVILPVNWAYSSDWTNFSDYNDRFLEVYSDIGSELGAIVVPVAAAYKDAFTDEGTREISTWFSDDRHPTPKATYMAACMEYGAITGTDPLDITYTPAGMTADEGAAMRRYASRAMNGYVNAISHLDGTLRFTARLYDDFGIELPTDGVTYTVDGGGTITPEGVFVSDGSRGTFTVSASCGEFTKTAEVTVTDHSTEVITYPALSLNADNITISEDFDSLGTDTNAEMPEAWRIDRQTVGTRTLGTYATAMTSTMYAGGVSLPSNAKNGLWNFGADGDSDRAPGGITTGVANGTRALNIYTHICNDGRKNLDKVDVAYNVEKYRKGNNQAGFAVQLHYSYDGRNWIKAGDDFYTYFAPDNATEGYAEVPGEIISVKGTLPVSLGAGLDLYLAWNISVASGDAAQGAMALGIDNVTFTGHLPEVPVCRHYIYVDNRTSWDALGLYAWGDSELFGAWPGQAPIDEINEDSTPYQVFGLDNEGGNFNLIFNNWNNNKQLPDFNITANRDYWLRIDDNKVEEIVPTSVDSVTEDGLGIVLCGKKVIMSEEAPIGVYSISGLRVASAYGSEMDLDMFPSGLYIITTPERAVKISLP
ncbi:MAG: hypothetical protein K2O24_04465 [Muribaculaceae bacterium]|nr:hypothetical protein [Muribaculaceae bacterium]